MGVIGHTQNKGFSCLLDCFNIDKTPKFRCTSLYREEICYRM